jgi:long-chain-fatty-acid--CoA ligase ACSBG
MYTVAKTLILSKIKAALGLDQAVAFYFGAAPLRQTSIEYFASLDIPIFNVYGMSETTGATTIHSADNFRLDSAGFAVAGTDLKILNPDENGEGEILMRGRNTMMGYLKNDQATMDTIDNQGFIKSGDRGKIEKDGHLKITGRIKEIIIGAGGENIAPVPVEDNFKESCPACSNIMMIGEAQRFMSALITFKVDVEAGSGQPSQTLTTEAQAYFKRELDLDLKTSDAACKEPKVLELVTKCLEETNKKSVSRAAHIRKFRLIPTDFSIPGGELTPTLKLKRKVTEKKYIALVEEMFAPDAKL